MIYTVIIAYYTIGNNIKYRVINPYSHKIEQLMHIQEVNIFFKKKYSAFIGTNRLKILLCWVFQDCVCCGVLFICCHIVHPRLQRLVDEALCCCYLLQSS